MLNWQNLLYDVDFMPFFLYMNPKKRREDKSLLSLVSQSYKEKDSYVCLILNVVCVLNSAMNVI